LVHLKKNLWKGVATPEASDVAEPVKASA
jgi:hypothetical protein